MKGENICNTCGEKFTWKRAAKQSIPQFCSMKCRGHTGFRPGCMFRISELSKEEKFEKLKKSFEKHVVRQDGCWSWKGPIARGGYPVMSCRPEIGSDRGHKASWLIHRGEVPEGLHVCHSCDNPMCTNPDHLWIGTSKENNDDKIAKGRGRWVHPPIKKGSDNGSSKLKECQVREIKILISQGHSSHRIGKKYNVSATTIKRIKSGVNWKHVE